MFDTTANLISRLLTDTIAGMDIPPQLHEAATREYKRAGDWLAANADGEEGWLVYPQGSFLLGTVVLPFGADEYDVDSVCVRRIAKNATTQQMLKEEVGSVLGAYQKAHANLADGPVALQERTRCWTLSYPRSMRFHLDELPAIPNPEAASPTGILITDRKLREWQRSDPQAFAAWFKGRATTEFLQKRIRLAEARRTEPQAIPEAEIKTTLQRVVQVLKLHRNRYFADDPDSRPASILLSTLAAHSYKGDQELYDAVVSTANDMADYLRPGPNGYSVPNPVEPRENFADRWQERPELANKFFAWLGQLKDDLKEADEAQGLDRVVAHLSESFGEDPVVKAAGELGGAYRRTREAAALSFAGSSGILSTKGSIPVRRHDFYGEVG
jgi:hypothetical protein